ncbi:MAG: alanyl-tRNA editing protein [Phycisphaerae bacterium]|nr:alanyl-tRNA editing protein [Phycisphaerae bacterium]
MERLYWTEPTRFELEVDVTALTDRRITIDPILFHPEEGGQPADTGQVGDATVMGVHLVNGQIVLSLDKPLGSGKHLARLDRKHRLHTASQHSAQHILSGLADTRFNLKTVGVHIGLERSTIDFETTVDWSSAQTLESCAMEVVMENLVIETVFNDTAVRSRFDLKHIDSELIRVVKIGQYDASACCGAHVHRTGDIGIIRVVDLETRKQGTRLSFIAGPKALAFSQTETSVLRSLRQLSHCATEELPGMLQKQWDRSAALSKAVDGLYDQMLPTLVNTAVVVETEGSKTGIQVNTLPGKLSGKLAALMADHVQGSGVVVSDTSICIHSKTMMAKELLQRLHDAVGGRGGGSPHAASGMLAEVLTREQIVSILQAPKNRHSGSWLKTEG